MKINAQEIQAVSAAQSSSRVDLYVGIHKATRAMMPDALLAVGRMDALDAVERNAVSARVLDLLDVPHNLAARWDGQGAACTTTTCATSWPSWSRQANCAAWPRACRRTWR